MLVGGTAASPIVYVSSSDPRWGGSDDGSVNDLNLDTNSGMVSRLTWNAATSTWTRKDVVRGLPRSEENHSVNGMVLNQATNTLYQSGSALERLCLSTGVRALGGDPVNRPGRHRDDDVRPADLERPVPGGRPEQARVGRQRSVRRQRRDEPGEDPPRRTGPGVLVRLAQRL